MLNRIKGYREGTGFGSIATICLLLIALWIAMGVHSGEVFGADQLEYLDEKGNPAFISDYTVLTDSDEKIGNDGGKEWYVVQDDLEPTSKAITVEGTAKLLLTNRSSLSTELISVTDGNRLEIYAQSTDETKMGKLQCQQKTLGGSSAAIGGNERDNAGTIVIWGGHISAKAKAAAAIGGGVGQKSGLVAIKAGVVKASSDDPFSAVIGGAKEGQGGSVIIDGGKVEVTGGGTGIGAGRQSAKEVTVSISAGTVTAQGDGNGYVAIGANQEDGDKPGAGAKVAIGGGHVKAISSSEVSGIGIGSKKGGTIRINGGTVEARGKDAGVGAKYPEDTEITIGWKNDTDYTASYYADSVKGSVRFDPGDRFIYKVEPGNIYTGSKEVDASSIEEKSTIIPYVYTVRYDKGKQGIGGTMPEHGANPNHDVYLPECGFTGADDYVFNKWKIGDEEYAARDKVKFKADTTVTATWGIPLTVSNIKTEDIPKQAKKANPLKIKGRTAAVKYKKLNKKAQTISRAKAITVTGPQGALTYKKVSLTYTKAKSVKMSKKALKKYRQKAAKKITINARSGKVTVKKGLKKGTYRVKVKVMAAGNENYDPSAWKTATVRIRIK